MGSDRPVRVDVRVVAATHRNLQQMVDAGTFRADLFYRLSVVPLRAPPLREIRQDIPLLVESFREQLNMRCRITQDAIKALQGYHWPGNVRELRNVLERAAVLCRNNEIHPKDLHFGGVGPGSQFDAPMTPVTPVSPTTAPMSRDHLKDQERQMIIDALARNNNNKTATARDLDIPLSTLKRRLKEYDIQ